MKREVLPISSRECLDWVLNKHYAKRKPRMQHCYGLFIDNLLEGVITFGLPATPFVARGLCGKEHEQEVIELSRLVINSKTPKNSASFLVANSIKQLPEKFKIVVSFADTSVGHIGYVYQATNFFYTGLTIDMKEWKKKGTNLHSQNVCKKLDLESRKHNNNFEQVQRPKKHRYILFRGNKKEKWIRLKALKYPLLPYPKGKTARYECIDILNKQSNLEKFNNEHK